MSRFQNSRNTDARRVQPTLEALESRELLDAGIPGLGSRFAFMDGHVHVSTEAARQEVGVVINGLSAADAGVPSLKVFHPGEVRGFNPQPDPPGKNISPSSGITVACFGDGSIAGAEVTLKQRTGTEILVAGAKDDTATIKLGRLGPVHVGRAELGRGDGSRALASPSDFTPAVGGTVQIQGRRPDFHLAGVGDPNLLQAQGFKIHALGGPDTLETHDYKYMSAQ